MDLICVDSKFLPDQLDFWKKHGVVHPEQEKMYNLREIIKHSNGQIGFRLEEIRNPQVPVKTPIGVMMIEPSFNHVRFRHLDGTPFSTEELREMLKTHKVIELND